ncbi:MAG: hypothetical protein AAGA25_13695 [Planctomycetota bacterium]
MLSVSLIERTLEARDYDRLLRDLADNGMEIPLSLRLRLCQCPAAPVALALRRLVELTYGPTRLSRELVERLLLSQSPEGGFAADCGHDRDPLVAAAVLAGLGRVAADHVSAANDDLFDSLDRGYAALAELQDCDGLFSSPSDRSLADRAMTSAFILSLLGSEPRFRDAVRLSELFRWFEAQEGRLDRHTQHLWDLASITSSHVEVEPLVFAA